MPPRDYTTPAPTITIVIQDGPAGPLVCTNAEPPAIGRLTTPAQALAMDVLRGLRSQVDQVLYGEQQVAQLSFLRDLLNPEALGHAVTPEVRDRARVLLGQKPVETRIARGGAAC